MKRHKQLISHNPDQGRWGDCYRNWRGEMATRRLRPVAFWHGSTEWHPTPGLMLKAVDLDKDAERDFAVADFNTATLRVVQ